MDEFLWEFDDRPTLGLAEWSAKDLALACTAKRVSSIVMCTVIETELCGWCYEKDGNIYIGFLINFRYVQSPGFVLKVYLYLWKYRSCVAMKQNDHMKSSTLRSSRTL